MKGKKLCSDAIFNINILNCVKLYYYILIDKVFNKKIILTTA